MNKYFYLIACLPFTLMGMEEYLNDYRTVLAIKNLVTVAAQKVKNDDAHSAVVLAEWRTCKHDWQQQTRQGYALEWDSNKPKIVWRLGTSEFSGDVSIQGKGESFFLDEIVKTFDAIEIARKPRLLRTRSGNDIPVGNQQIITFALRKLNDSILPEAQLKEGSELIDEVTARSLYKQLETH